MCCSTFLVFQNKVKLKSDVFCLYLAECSELVGPLVN